MVNKYFKIIELPDYDILISKDYITCDGRVVYLLVLTFFYYGYKLDTTLGFDKEEIRNDEFNNITSEKAKELIENTIKGSCYFNQKD